MGAFAPYLMSAAAGYGVNKAGNAIFGNGSQNATAQQPVMPQQQQPPVAHQILQQLQQQMQMQEQQRQQAIMALLSQFSQPTQMGGKR